MYPIDIPAIERQARELRAAEIQRINGLFAERTLLLTRLAASSILAGAHAISELLRPCSRGIRKNGRRRCRQISHPRPAVSTTLRAPCFPGIRRSVAPERQAANAAGDLTRVSGG
ncbi:MAG: hypothetical protein HZT41_16885 [Dechloromonas sp.]|nr:MAG: hypothetical protein HZT41_16885 [Dechloromonas sp.]